MDIRPKIEFLGKDEIEYIVNSAKEVLQKVGIKVENPEVVELLSGYGAEVRKGRVYISPETVECCLETAPKSIDMYDRNGNWSMILQNDNVYFNPGSAATFFLDYDLGRLRKPVVKDYVKFTKVVEMLDNIDAQSTAVVPQDIPPELQDSYRLYIALMFSKKPVITGAFAGSGLKGKSGFDIMHEMLVNIRGSESKLQQKPLAIFDCCPSSPLVWSPETSKNLVDCSRLGIPAELISMPQPGVQAPPTLEGGIIQHTAETLSGIVISQLAKPGAPVIYGGSPGTADMRGLQFLLGSAGTHLMACAYVEIGKYLGLPTHAYMGVSDTQLVDMQAGFETGNGILLAALAGINNVSGPGMLYNEQGQSIEKLVIDNDVCGMAMFIAQGVRSFDVNYVRAIKRIVKENTAMMLPETIKRLHGDWDDYQPRVLARERNIEGYKGAYERAHELALQLVATHDKEVGVNEEVRARLNDVMKTYVGSESLRN